MIENNLMPVGYIGAERKPAYLKTHLIEFVSVEEMENWMNDSSVLIIDDQESKLIIKTKQEMELEIFTQKWMMELNEIIA